MFDSGAAATRQFFDWILPLYRDVNFSYAIAAVMALVAIVLVIVAVVQHVRRTGAIVRRTRSITSFVIFDGGQGHDADADPQEIQFASRFAEIDARLSQGEGADASLAAAWRRYRKTLSFLDAPPIRSTQQPSDYFYAATPPPSWLGFSANIFVAFGLLATFLGLVAALTFSAAGMSSSDPGAMQAALRDLLSAASSKFVTSVAGVGLSILLRLVERGLTIDLRRKIDALSRSLEFGVRVDRDANSAAVASQISRLLSRYEAPKPAQSAGGA